jgi:hypothetical protein
MNNVIFIPALGSVVTESIPYSSLYEYDTDEFSVDSVYQQAAFLDVNKNVVVIWTGGNGATGGKTYVNTYDASGTTISANGSNVLVRNTGYDSKLGFDVDHNTGNKLLLAQEDEDDSNRGKCNVITVTAGVPSVGTSVTFDSAGSVTDSGVAADSQTADKYLIVWEETSGSNSLWVAVVTVSGTTPTVGTPVVVATAGGSVTGFADVDIAADPKNADKYAIAYRVIDTGNDPYHVRIITVSGTTPTVGAAYTATPTVNTPGRHRSGICWDYVNGDKLAVVWRDQTDLYGKVRVGSVSGTTITFGTTATYYSNTGTEGFGVSFDHFIPDKIMLYKGRGTSDDDGAVTEASVIGTTVSGITEKDGDFFPSFGSQGGIASSPYSAGWFVGWGRSTEGFIRTGIMGGEY